MIYQNKLYQVRRKGITLVEVVVAAILLTTGIALSTVAAGKATRIVRDARDYRFAVDALTLHVERLRALQADELPDALADLNASEALLERFPKAEIRGNLLDDQFGRRVRVILHLDAVEVRRPLEAIVWLTKSQEVNDESNDGVEAEINEISAVAFPSMEYAAMQDVALDASIEFGNTARMDRRELK